MPTINTDGISKKQRHTPKFQQAYQEMLFQVSNQRFVRILCCHEAAHLFYFKAAGMESYKALTARLRYDPATDDYCGSLASVEILDRPQITNLDQMRDTFSKVPKALAAGGVVARQLMSAMGGVWPDPTGGDQDDKDRLTDMCKDLSTKVGVSIDADASWKCAQDEVSQDLSEHPEWLAEIEKLAEELRPELGL